MTLHTAWTVLPHDPIERLSDRVWRVAAALPGAPMKRVMTVARRDDGGLAIHNGIALDAAALAALDAWGPVRVIAVPNGYHRIDARPYADRYPDAQVICPAGAAARVARVTRVTGRYEDALPDPAIEWVTLAGTREREGAMIVREPSGCTLVLNDAVFNMPHAPGLTGFILRRVTGSTGGPRVSRVMRWLVIADAMAFRAHLEQLARLPDLRRIIVSHHEPICDDPSGVLLRVAATL
jgi:hypothetical protein